MQNRISLIKEFKKVSDQISKPGGLRGIIINFSSCFSANVTILMQKLGYNRRILAQCKGKIILNIGCGDVISPNYLNTDLFPRFGDIIRIVQGKTKLHYHIFLDLTYYDRFLTECADGIILSHVLEHIPPNLVIQSLKNCYSYLKNGGVMRVSVPYLGAYDQEKIPPNQKITNRMLAKNSLIYGWNHKFMYDAEILSALMEEVGFKDVKEVHFGEGLLGESDIPERQPETIYITGVK